MAYNMTGGSSTDDYAKDIKMDQSVQLGEAPCSITWMRATQYNNVPAMFAVTSWDKTVRIFQIALNQAGGTIMQRAVANLSSPGLCASWNTDNTSLYIGCADGVVKQLDLNTMNFGSDVGKQNAGISSVHYVPQLNCVMSTGYENTVNFWQNNPTPVMSINVQNKIFCSDFKNGVIAGGILGEKLFVIDLNMVSQGGKSMIESTDLGKSSQLQSVTLDEKAETIGMATADGRANISGLVKTQSQEYKLTSIITFKSNKQDQAGSIILYPVNSASFSPTFENWYMTAGSDGVMSFWDYKARNKIKSFIYSGNPICCASVSPSGTMVAYGQGNDWHIGEEGIGKWQNRLGVHIVAENETKFQGVATTNKK